MKNENELKFSFFIFQILRKMNWHSGSRIQNNFQILFSILKFKKNGNWTQIFIFQLSEKMNDPNVRALCSYRNEKHARQAKFVDTICESVENWFKYFI